MTVYKTEHYDCNGTQFDIISEEEDGSYFGKWVCHACGENGGSGKECRSAEDALELAKQNLSAHQFRIHGNKNP